MENLPVREMVLYKSGIGFFVRMGDTDTNVVALTFRADEINDVLKSLTVFDRAGGQVLGIHYQTPMDIYARLASSSIRLSQNASLRDLIANLRGRQATVSFETAPGTLELITGRIIGLDDPDTMRGNVADSTDPFVSILTDAGQVKVYRLEMLRGIEIHDPQSGHDLSYFLDTSMSEDERRIVHVRLSEGQHDLYVAYVAPSPTWRVSYRIVAESDENAETGKALLQGWGLFDNRLEEDLNDVRVTLVAGQPISFIYELYASRIPFRPTVQDEARVASGPIEFVGGAAMPDFLMDADEAEPSAWLESQAVQKRARAINITQAMPAPAAPPPSRAQFAQSAPAAAETKDSGEFFQYIVTTPVSVKRGESALVPIIGSEISYQRELLYNGAKLPNHPVASLRFDNKTGLTLERGPITVVEDGDYKGEAVVAFTKDGNQVYLPYAVELGIKVTERPSNSVVINRLSIKDAFLVYEEYYVEEVKYTLENTTAKAQTVTVEAPIRTHYHVFDTPNPDIETANERRWRVSVPARGKAEFARKERQLRTRHQELLKLDYTALQRFLENRWLDENTLEQLQQMLYTRALIVKLQAEQKKLEQEKQGIFQQQDQLRANMQALNPTGDEATFRKRIVRQLEETQNRLDEIAKEQHNVARQIAEAEEKIKVIIQGLN